MTTTEKKLKRWACGEIQHQRGHAAIVMSDKASLEPVMYNPILGDLSPVCSVAVPVILESREEAICHHYFTGAEVERICGVKRIA